MGYKNIKNPLKLLLVFSKPLTWTQVSHLHWVRLVCFALCWSLMVLRYWSNIFVHNIHIFEKSNLILLQLRNRVEFTKVECVTQLPEVLQVNCSINRTPNNVSALLVDFKLSQDVYSSNGIFSLFVKHGNNSIKYDTQNIDYCTVLANFHDQYLFQMITSGIRKISNIPLSCPFKKVNYDHKYVWTTNYFDISTE